jgi:hypothetical protein
MKMSPPSVLISNVIKASAAAQRVVFRVGVPVTIGSRFHVDEVFSSNEKQQQLLHNVENDKAFPAYPDIDYDLMMYLCSK